MSKRYCNNFSGEKSSPAKRPKLDITKTSDHVVLQRQQTNNTDNVINEDDIWGDDDDFDEEAFEVIDNIASQAFSQAVNTSLGNIYQASQKVININNNEEGCSDSCESNINDIEKNKQSIFNKPNLLLNKYHNKSPKKTNGFTSKPSTSYETSKTNGFSLKKNNMYSQKLASSIDKHDFHDETITSSQFCSHLIAGNNLNSTLQMIDTVVTIDDNDNPSTKLINELKRKNEKLMRDNTSSDGEILFLRSKMSKIQSESDKMKAALEKQNQETVAQLEAKIKNLLNENDSLKKDNNLKDHDLKNSIERLKLIEKSSIKLTNPQSAVTSSNSTSPFQLKHSINDNIKPVKKLDFSMQTETENNNKNNENNENKNHYNLLGCYYPLRNIPQEIFETSLLEKSVVDIKIPDKIGHRRIPILHDIFSSRIFENPLLVKPIVTVVNSKNLNVEFYLPQLSSLIKKTNDEINSSTSLSEINKIILTSMELLLNTTVVLKTIDKEMQNDDIKDMDDLYFSNFYKQKINHNKSLCSSKLWYDKERGIETRRSFSIISYISKTSKYLSDYISGKIQLSIINDEQYNIYSSQLIRYNEWQLKHKNYQVLKLINEFVCIVCKIRRSHQFTGLICSLLDTLYSVDKLSGFNDTTSINYICNIFKEIVFSRPLMSCFPTITKTLSHFSKSYDIFVDNLCKNLKKTKIIYHNNERKFNYDSCLLRVFMLQLEKFDFDLLTNIDITNSLIEFVDHIFTLEKMKWPLGQDHIDECECREHLLTHASLLIYDMLMLDIKQIDDQYHNQNKHDDIKIHYWNSIKDKHRSILKTSTRFLCSLAWLDHRFVLHAHQPILEHKVQLSWDKLRSVNADTADVIDKYVAETVESKLILDRENIQLKNLSLSEKIYNKKHGFNKYVDESMKKKTKWSNAKKLHQLLFQ